ncbi:hypothetical protein EDD22DRAFT_851776 [Suillus occidentalis]|nr:hypothetical protein EDD22DRAFT_851776 [Suillus occidentalis]
MTETSLPPRTQQSLASWPQRSERGLQTTACLPFKHRLPRQKPSLTERKQKQRLLAQEERAEAARQELDWQSSQARKSVLQTEEQDKIEDDPNAGDDDDLEEVHHRNTRKRLRGGGGGGGGGEGGEGEDSDGALEAQIRAELNAEVGILKAHYAKKLKSNIAGPTFEASTPTVLHSKLPLARSSTLISRSPATPILPRSLPAMTPIPSTPTHTSHHHSSKPRMLDQTPVTRAVVKTANCIFRVYVATDNGFPTEDEIAAHTRASFKRACKDLKQNDILTRFEADAAYAATEAKIVAARPSQIRGELKSKVQSAVAGHFGLHGLSKAMLEVKIAALLHEHAYVFQNPDKRQGFFRHPIFTEIFGAQWLRKRGEATGEYAAAFNPVPLPTLALIATAIECALRDYVKGFKETRRGFNEFSGDSYRGSYESHLLTLRRQEKKHPQLILKLRRDIFQAAYNGDVEETEENNDYLGDFDLEADMDQ